MNISEIVVDCLSQFKILASGGDDAFKDEYGRFRTWVGSVAAHRTGLRSLQHRLRDSTGLKQNVLSLLQDMRSALLCFASTTSASDDEKEKEDFFDSDEDAELESASRRELDDIHEINSCLLRLSLALRNPARHDRLKQLETTSTKHFEPWDIAHVQQKFPSAEPYLHRRLGKALSKQRQYFKYCQEHHSKKTEGLDDAAEEDKDKQTTIATSLREAFPVKESAAIADEFEVDSNYTTTSFAPTISSDAVLRPPPMPEAGQDGEEFVCPLCYSIVAMASDEAWKRHVYYDLAPYVCTYKDCGTPEHRYSQRRNWQDHVINTHHTGWCCPFGCKSNAITHVELQKHLSQHHDIVKIDASLHILCKAHARALSVDNEFRCHLCGKQEINKERWFKHMGRDLQQLALHTVPKSLMSTESDNEAEDITKTKSEAGITELDKESDDTNAELRSNDSEKSESNRHPELQDESLKDLPSQTLTPYESTALGVRENPTEQSSKRSHASEASGSGWDIPLSKETFVYRPVSKQERDDTQSAQPPRRGSTGDMPAASVVTIYPDDREGVEEDQQISAKIEEAERDESERRAPFWVSKGKEAYEAVKAEEQRVRAEIEEEATQQEEQQQREWEEFLAKQKAEENEQLRKKKGQEVEVDEELRRRLLGSGYSEEDVERLLEREKLKRESTMRTTTTSRNPLSPNHTPTYVKVKKVHISTDTLKYYDIPWEYDQKNKDYIIILKEMSTEETDVLFEHTKRLREGKLLLEPEPPKDKPKYAWYRKRDRSPSRVRKVGILEYQE